MIENLLQLKPNTMLSIDDKNCIQFTGQQDYTIVDVKKINSDENNVIVIVNLKPYYLIAIEYDSDISYSLCEFYDDSQKYLKESKFPKKITLENNDELETYTKYNTMKLNDYSFAEYSGDCFLDYLLIKRKHKHIILYRGLQFQKNNLIT